MGTFIDYCTYILLRLLIYVLRVIPYRIKSALFLVLLKAFLVVKPGYRDIAFINMRQVFPDKDDQWYQSLLNEHLKSLAAIIVDTTFLPFVSKRWIAEHVSLNLDQGAEAALQNKERPVLMAAGHLGSFELMPPSGNALIEPLAFVVRSFKNPFIDQWWNRVREQLGNEVIARKGAVKKLLKRLNENVPVAFLFDQNVVRNNAVFVDFFGRPAATTAALGTLSLKTGADILLVSIKTLSPQRFELKLRYVDFMDIVNEGSESSSEKIRRITERVTKNFEQEVLENPSAWLWFHRRWKTRPENSELAHLYDPSKDTRATC